MSNNENTRPGSPELTERLERLARAAEAQQNDLTGQWVSIGPAYVGNGHYQRDEATGIWHVREDTGDGVWLERSVGSGRAYWVDKCRVQSEAQRQFARDLEREKSSERE